MQNKRGRPAETEPDACPDDIPCPALHVLARRGLRLPKRALPGVIGLGVMGISLGNVAQSFGVQACRPLSRPSFPPTIPIFIVILAAIRFKQPVTLAQWSGLAAAFSASLWSLSAAGRGSTTCRSRGSVQLKR
ncbi:DMT family transporter [Rhizobium sp. R339]|uniref:DMT family transporter n=1 Tax=Rhizobium sp. R339 TaxID=1764273 RepID=UPI0032AF37E4